MTSVKEIAAHFDKKDESNQALVPSESDRLETPSSGSSLDTRDNSLSFSQFSRASPHPEKLRSTSRSRVTDMNLEMGPMSQVFQSSNGRASEKPRRLDILNPTSSILEPIPPSQKARFLHGATPAPSSLSDSSTLDAPQLSASNYDVSKQPVVQTIASPITSHSLFDSPLLDSGLAESHHTPLPMTQLFSRNAAPLYLPELDDVLEKLPLFEFTHAQDSSGTSRMFSPMNLLRGRRLKDLVRNDLPTPLWRDWNSIGSTVRAICQKKRSAAILMIAFF